MFDGEPVMAIRITFKALVAAATASLALGLTLAPGMALAGGTGAKPGCGCHPKPPPPPPPPQNCHCKPNININNTNNNYNNNKNNNYNNNTNNNTNNNYNNLNVVVNTNTQVSNQVALRNQVNVSNSFLATQTQEQIVGGSSGSASSISAGSVTAVNLGVGGNEEREAFESERTKIEKVVIQAFCFDTKEVPHPASQVFAEREIAESYSGEVYRCIAGAHMQVTIAPFREEISFANGKTLVCHEGEALWYSAGGGEGMRESEGGRAGHLACRPQIPARDCNERSLLRRFGAGIKVLTMVMTEKVTAYRERSSSATTTAMSFDGGVGGFVN
jgi:hypothetical protein